MPDDVLVEVIDGVAVITINRPQARNAVNEAVAPIQQQVIETLGLGPLATKSVKQSA